MASGSGNGGGDSDDEVTGKHVLWDDEPARAVSNRDLSRMIWKLSRGLTAHGKAIQDLRDIDKARSSSIWKTAIALAGVLILPLVGAIWQGGRLIERIDQIAVQVQRVSDDHEHRIRELERAPLILSH